MLSEVCFVCYLSVMVSGFFLFLVFYHNACCRATFVYNFILLRGATWLTSTQPNPTGPSRAGLLNFNFQHKNEQILIWLVKA